MKKRIKSVLACVLSVALFASVCVSTGDSADAATPKLNKTKLTMRVGDKKTLKVNGKKGKVKWSSTKKKVATVSSKGVVVAKSKGTATIIAKVASKKLKCKVTVNPKKAVKNTEKTVVTSTSTPIAANETSSPVPTQAATSTIAPTTLPTASPAPEATDVPEPAATPKYMQEGAFVYDKLDISWIDPEQPMIAFTFDDGPVGSEATSYGMRIQAALAKYGYHATFNYITNKCNSETSKNEVLAAVAAGHEIGNHTTDYNYDKPLDKFDSGEDVANEIEEARKVLSELTGISNFTLRPPNLATNEMVLENCNVPLINSTSHCNSNDWITGTTKEQIIQNVKNAVDGDIVLMHETNPETAAAVEELVEYYHEEGFQIVSVVELFAAKDIPLFPGVLYDKAEYKEPRE